MRFTLFTLLVAISILSSAGIMSAQSSKKLSSDILFEKDGTTTIYVQPSEKEVVHSAVELLRNDVKNVVGANLIVTDNLRSADIVVESSAKLIGKWEAFAFHIERKGSRRQLKIQGSDARGKAYGIMELSRIIGVSPWYYFADVKSQQLSSVAFPMGRAVVSPSVKYRGIFLNDEDWGLMPWATQTLAPQSAKGAIGPEAYAKIFELMLRLRANTIWPAMHECTVPFYFVKGNREMADKYGIVVGTSHCEPLARNSAAEWDVAGTGDYNFITNRDNVLNYWSERLIEQKNSENIFTVGMRGKHDGMMQGVKTLKEHKAALSEIIPAQQKLLGTYINPKPSEVPQVFIPYKEVLDVYNDGLEVPGHITLIWCDDNFGYIKRLSDEDEQRRSGSSGVYYHVSYWGRPHDYLWLATTSPSLIYTEMKRAYQHGADRLWILNVGDLKPAEYLTEYFLDMAWDIESAQPGFSHLEQWMHREFGALAAKELTAIKKEYYRLATLRKPEFMGWSRVEEPGFGRGGRTPVRSTEYNPDSSNELQRRIDAYSDLENRVGKLQKQIPARLQSAWYQLVEYPVRASSLMSQKWLYAQLARSKAQEGDSLNAVMMAGRSERAYAAIEAITLQYNSLEDGKWKGMMNLNPRSLPVFEKPDFSTLDSLIRVGKPALATKEAGMAIALNASQADNGSTTGTVVDGLGHSFSAVQLPAGETLHFTFDLPKAGEYWIRIAAIPNHDVDEKGMKIQLLADDKEIKHFDYKTVGRSETFKLNVLRGQAISLADKVMLPKGKVRISVKAITSYIQLDQVMVGQGEMNFYEFPVK